MSLGQAAAVTAGRCGNGQRKAWYVARGPFRRGPVRQRTANLRSGVFDAKFVAIFVNRVSKDSALMEHRENRLADDFLMVVVEFSDGKGCWGEERLVGVPALFPRAARWIREIKECTILVDDNGEKSEMEVNMQASLYRKIAEEALFALPIVIHCADASERFYLCKVKGIDVRIFDDNPITCRTGHVFGFKKAAKDSYHELANHIAKGIRMRTTLTLMSPSYFTPVFDFFIATTMFPPPPSEQGVLTDNFFMSTCHTWLSIHILGAKDINLWLFGCKQPAKGISSVSQ
ncbi:uncharacterized protein BDR25DRAFT_351719 [Lindgomyces ingoldianus]|uniref:Uncharacterized protein n=1 Tax=Lindgomyces ingoldianus TaxID=673940 RepID=A0ACB6R789_9PLEO|nr:uncharacterized protein BDR25DRAFT_351719 [Lindgomyces ingoldianus]KAF2474187.1 hypothetical protein BDR25DRAFT_351719 [Lindgomyces ingoldianus]